MHWHKITLTQKDLIDIEEAEKKVEKVQLLKRLQCIKLKAQQWRNDDLAKFFNVCLDTVTNWIKAYSNGGVEGLLQWEYKGRVSVLTLEDQQKIKDRNKQKAFGTAKEAKAFIKKEFGIDWHLHWVQKLLKKNFDFRAKNQD